MIKRFLLTSALVTVGVTFPAYALPQCYIIMGGVQTDLSHMCGDNRQVTPSVVGVSAVESVRNDARVWSGSFYNNRQFNAFNELVDTTEIQGNIHNTGDDLAKNVVIEAIGYAPGRLPQTQEQTIELLGPNTAESIRFDFDFSVPVETWDVRVISWD